MLHEVIELEDYENGCCSLIKNKFLENRRFTTFAISCLKLQCSIENWRNEALTTANQKQRYMKFILLLCCIIFYSFRQTLMEDDAEEKNEEPDIVIPAVKFIPELKPSIVATTNSPSSITTTTTYSTQSTMGTFGTDDEISEGEQLQVRF